MEAQDGPEGVADQYRLVFEASPAPLIVHHETTLRILAVNEASVRQYGRSREEFLGMTMPELSSPGEWERFEAQRNQPGPEPDSVPAPRRCRHQRKDGSLLDVEVQESRVLFQGEPAVVSLPRDVSIRLKVQRDVLRYREQLQALTERLLTAHEEERRRIGLELHDSVTQSLALLAMDAGRLASGVSFSPLGEEIRGLQQRIRVLANEIRMISHELHPGALEDLGLELALRAHCEEITARDNIDVRFLSRDVPRELELPVATAIYRIAQEALHNVIKHSHAREASVTLEGSAGGLRLCVEDDGVGLSAAAEESKASLGLISMKERVRLLDGTISITSHHGAGVKIDVWAPLPSAAKEAG